MSTATLTALLPLLLLLLPLGACLKGQQVLGGWRPRLFGHRVLTREEVRRSLRVIQGGRKDQDDAPPLPVRRGTSHVV